MPVYSYFIFGGRKHPPVQFELEQDESAIALSICLLRDTPDIAQVWIIANREPVAVRVRDPNNELGALIDLRDKPVAQSVCA